MRDNSLAAQCAIAFTSTRPTSPPVRTFWSLTTYDTLSKFSMTRSFSVNSFCGPVAFARRTQTAIVRHAPVQRLASDTRFCAMIPYHRFRVAHRYWGRPGAGGGNFNINLEGDGRSGGRRGSYDR
jgi:hypothetical protein